MDAARPWREAAGGLVLRVRVTPRAGRDIVAGLYQAADGSNALSVKVRATPADNQANEAVLRCLAKLVGRPVSALTLQSGATARVKTIAIAGEAAPIQAALEHALLPTPT